MGKNLSKKLLLLAILITITTMIFTTKSNAQNLVTEESIAISKHDLLTGETSIINVSTEDKGR